MMKPICAVGLVTLSLNERQNEIHTIYIFAQFRKTKIHNIFFAVFLLILKLEFSSFQNSSVNSAKIQNVGSILEHKLL